jgi:hypothetical protein
MEKSIAMKGISREELESEMDRLQDQLDYRNKKDQDIEDLYYAKSRLKWLQRYYWRLEIIHINK